MTHTETTSPAATELAITGMTCNNCARHVVEAIQSVPEVANASVQLDAGRANVRWRGVPNLSGVLQAITEAGYEARALEKTSPDSETKISWSPLAGWRFNVVVGLICTVPLMIGEWVPVLAMQSWFPWAAFALALPVQVLCGAKFYTGAWRQLKIGSSNMDTLVALGSTTAFGYSVWALFTGAPGHLYFADAAAIITIISIGHWFETRTSARAEAALQALLHLAPETARRRNSNGSETEVPVSELRLQDVVVLKPGDHVPVDGELAEGAGAVDEAMLTGESLPVEKKSGDKLFAGTVNLNGNILMRVVATGDATALAHIIAAVERAQNSRAEIQRLGDKVSSVFVPVVVLIALATALWWGLAGESARQTSTWLAQFLWPTMFPTGALASAFIQAAAVLIIACPCAMGLATPIAIMAGANAAARRGILIRDGIALERAGKVTAIVFDKTGTLTQGHPIVAAHESYSPEMDVLQFAASLARGSNHPLSQAVAKLSGKIVSLENWKEVRGAGVVAEWKQRESVEELRLGSLRWLRELGVETSLGKAFEEKWGAQGATLLGLVADKKLLALFALKDALKPGADKVVRALQADGLNVYLLTGDNELTARAIAQQAGISIQNVFADVRPERKAQFIEDLREKGERVAFVGDGINDAPALESADLGIAVSSASDVARAAADIILLKSEIQAVPEALGLARAALRTIKQNLFWAFFYNAAGIPLAALGFINPLLCALAMGLSDLVVISNALRLLRWKFKTRTD